MKNPNRTLIPVLVGSGLMFLAPAAFANTGHDPDSKFAMMDTDHDGRISRAEHAAAVAQKFSKLDANGDGFITTAEMENDGEKTTTRKWSEEAEEKKSATQRIAAMDSNSDGKLSKAEFEAGEASMFAKMDTNGDGYLSKAEFEAGHRMMNKEK